MRDDPGMAPGKARRAPSASRAPPPANRRPLRDGPISGATSGGGINAVPASSRGEENGKAGGAIFVRGGATGVGPPFLKR